MILEWKEQAVPDIVKMLWWVLNKMAEVPGWAWFGAIVILIAIKFWRKR